MAILARPRSIRFIQVLRITVVLFIAAAGVFLLRGNYGPDALWVVDIPLAGLTLVYIISSTWLLSSLEEEVPLDEDPLYVQVFLDVLLMGLVVFYTGASSSTLMLIFLVPVVLASAFLYLRGSLFAASLSTIALALLIYLDARGFLAEYGPSYVQEAVMLDLVTSQEGGELLARWLAASLSLFAAAFISGYMAENQVTIVKELSELSRRMERVRLDTSDVLANLESGLVTVDADRRIVFFNQAAREILDISGLEPQGRPYDRVFTGRLEHLGELIRRCFEGDDVTLRNEVQVELPGGRKIPLGVSPTILEGEESIRGVVLIFQDLTEAKRVEEKIRRQDRLAVIGELSAGIAHELRNPIASISGSVEVLSESADLEDEEDQRLLRLVQNESARVNEIVEDFLNYARIERAERVPVELGPLLDDVITLARNHPSFREKREIVVDVDGCPPIMGDPGQMKQVFLNLVLNGLEAISGDGEVRVRCPGPGEEFSLGEEMVEVWVQDDGPGVPVKNAGEIFEPFYTDKRGGTGLGLAVVQRIVESHDGRILYAPSRDGTTTFRVYLPRAEENA
ncbi:MAG: ATP-binding protein [bacterium]